MAALNPRQSNIQAQALSFGPNVIIGDGPEIMNVGHTNEPAHHFRCAETCCILQKLTYIFLPKTGGRPISVSVVRPQI